MKILTTQKQLRNTKHTEGVCFKCHQCKQVKPVQTSGGTGYGYDSKTNRPVCYQCCGENDRKNMIETGNAVLYLSNKTVTNWPGTLKFNCHVRSGRHNIARVRYDCWFTGPDGKQWHGVTIGDFSQICRCKRLKG